MNLQSRFNNDSENTNFLIVIPSQEILFTKLQNFCYIWPRLHILNYFLSLHTLGHEPYGIYYLFTKIHKNYFFTKIQTCLNVLKTCFQSQTLFYKPFLRFATK